jgi:cyclophilin family peptidyl-prolyl cis-trans isomerase
MRSGIVLVGLVVAGAVAVSGTGCTGPEARTLEHLSPVYTIDRPYRSMVGPASTQAVAFAEASLDPPELLWVTGYSAVVVGPDGKTSMPQDFMCHSNLNFDSGRHSRLFDLPVYHGDRLFTLSQGQQEIHLPAGFGLPYWSDETFDLTTQVLNLNHDGRVHEVRYKVTLDYVRDRDLKQPMKPLFMTSGWGLVLLEGEGGVFGVPAPDEEVHGPGCLPGESAGMDKYRDGFERQFSGHWVVKPGREVNRTNVTRILKIPYDTTLHYVAVHLHPFAESLELIDLTDGKTVFKSDAEGYGEEKIGLKRVEYISSVEGLPVYADHEYELVSTYNNTTSENQDSMAVALMYLLDQRFEKRERDTKLFPRVAHVERPLDPGDDLVVFHTSHGDITVEVYPEVAPRHVERVLDLVRKDVYDGTPFSRVEPGFLLQTGYPQARETPLSAEQLGLLQPLRSEFSDLNQQRGTVSMVLNDDADPDSGVASFFIALDRAAHLDFKYTIFGQVTSGFDTIDRILAVPREGNEPLEPVVIENAEVVSRTAIASGRKDERSAG